MRGGWLARMRWRRRGAWLWPVFIVAAVADGLIGHLLPPAGDAETIVSAALIGLVLNLVGVILLSRPLGALLRRARRDLPAVVARDYAGTVVVLAVSAGVLAAGLVHRATVLAHQQALHDATVRAEAFIGDRAPAAFRADAQDTSTLAIEEGFLYRVCVPSADHKRTYCVIVNTHLPFARSVTFSGYEPNWIFGQGTG